ncbi:hypothetical protein DF105_01050 [Burkholderia stagnalis]|uniref:hypothetical protein n=1 Tax=Burkholderia stagnalis TaxID=1503054 RepID=UPI000F5FE68D|nr:hypothetical protein [Burkholderia stagnalis]RQZ08920.1 hypothetical protein DF105_01050 [Burkholderia stagnalis]
MVKVIAGPSSLFVDGRRVGKVAEIDDLLREMWDRYALQPSVVHADGAWHEREPQQVVIHWDRRNGWSVGAKP